VVANAELTYAGPIVYSDWKLLGDLFNA